MRGPAASPLRAGRALNNGRAGRGPVESYYPVTRAQALRRVTWRARLAALLRRWLELRP